MVECCKYKHYLTIFDIFFLGTEHLIQNPNLDLNLSSYLRDILKLTGTKIACGTSGCGACTVTLSQKDYSGKLSHRAINSCTTKLWTLHGCHITTVEKLNKHAIQGDSLFKL